MTVRLTSQVSVGLPLLTESRCRPTGSTDRMGTPVQVHPRHPRSLSASLDQHPAVRFRPLKSANVSPCGDRYETEGFNSPTLRIVDSVNSHSGRLITACCAGTIVLSFGAGEPTRPLSISLRSTPDRRILHLHDLRRLRRARVHRPRPLRRPAYRTPDALVSARIDQLPPRPPHPHRLLDAPRPLDHHTTRPAPLLLASTSRATPANGSSHSDRLAPHRARVPAALAPAPRARLRAPSVRALYTRLRERGTNALVQPPPARPRQAHQRNRSALTLFRNYFR